MTFKELRENKGITVMQVSKKINRKTSTIYMYETSKRLPSFTILTQLASIYNVSLDEMKATYDYHRARMNSEPTIEDCVGEILVGMSDVEKSVILHNVLSSLKITATK